MQTREQDRLGWLPAGVLALLIALTSSAAWSLDLDHEIAKSNADSSQIASTLGRGHHVNNASTSGLHLQLLPAKKEVAGLAKRKAARRKPASLTKKARRARR